MYTAAKSYQSLLERYPAQVDACIKKLRKGTSKHKGDAPETFEWGFYWGVTGTAISLGELLTVVPAKGEPKQEVVACLQMSKKRFWAQVKLDSVPEEITAERTAQAEKIISDHVAEVERWSKMTPAEQQKEREATLKTLFGTGTFAAIMADISEEEKS